MGRFALIALLVITAAACGEAGEPAVSSTTATLPDSTSTPPTTVSDIPAEIEELLDQLDAAWTEECDEAATEVARSRVQSVVDWAPSYEQSLGSFGGDMSDEVTDIAAFIETECPEAGSVIRFIDVVDDEFPRGDVNAALALSSMLELSLLHLGWEIGIPMAERLAPQTADDAPAAPVWDPSGDMSCAQLEAESRDYFQTYIESLNNISPAQSYNWDGAPADEGSVGGAAVSPLDFLAASDCDTETALYAMLEGAADADAISFFAETTRWSLISGVRDYLFTEGAGETGLTISPLCDEESTYWFTVTNEGTAEAVDVIVEVAGTDGSGDDDSKFTWSQDSIAPGETVTVESTISRDQQFDGQLSWIDDKGVTHRQNVGLGCFTEIGTGVPDS
jgi:hypothetical protein